VYGQEKYLMVSYSVYNLNSLLFTVVKCLLKLKHFIMTETISVFLSVDLTS